MCLHIYDNNISQMSQSPPASAALSPPRVLALLSDPRTAPYRDRFKPATYAELLGVYMWSQALSASFHPFVGFAEVVLRNAIHQTLSEQCSGDSSLSYAWYDRAAHGALPLRGKSLERVEEQLCEGRPAVRKVVQPSPDAMIASLSFGFWPNVMEGLSHRYAPHTFTKVFTYHPNSKPQHWSKDANKTLVVLRLKRLQDLRNRISHFEPIWKLHWLNIQAPH